MCFYEVFRAAGENEDENFVKMSFEVLKEILAIFFPLIHNVGRK